MNKNKNIFTFKIIIILLLCICLKSQSFAAISEIIYDDCYIIKTFGTKTGYLCAIQREKSEKGKKYIVTERHLYQKIKRSSEFVEITQETSYVEDKSGNPVSFETKLNSSGENTAIAGKFISDNEISVDFNINGVKSSKNVKFKEKILFPYAIDELYKYPDSKTVNYSTIEPSLDIRVIKVKTESQGQENLSIDGLNHNYYKYKTSTNILPGIASYEWRSRNGKNVKESIPLLKIEQILANKKEIMNISGEINDENNYDLFSGSLISVNKAITDPDLLNQIDYKIKISGDMDTDNLFIKDERQKISKLDKGTIYLTVKTEIPEAQSFTCPVDTKNLEEYLESGPFIMPDSDKISVAAKILGAGETDAYILAKKMEAWVFNNIANKNFSYDFANAIKVLETKTGDCTEHAVLLASFLRAAGIPSKIVVGLMYTEIPKPAFGYHMWVKAYVGNGRWVNLDATLPYKNFVPVHLAMAESPLNNISDRADLFINVFKSFSGIKIEILNADKPVVTTLDNGIIKINPDNSGSTDYLVVKTGKTENANIKEISLTGLSEQDYAKSAFYNFTKGEIIKASDEFNINYNLIPEGDDFSHMKLGLKLSELGFFNLALKTFNDVKDKDIWGLKIYNSQKLHFPEKKYSPSNERIICDVISRIKFQNLPDESIKLINQNKKSFQNDDYAHYLTAKAYILKNKLELAQNELQKALKLDPENMTYRMELAKIYTQRNSYKSAEREFNLVNKIAKKEEIQDKEFWQEFNEQNYWMKFKAERNNPLKSKFYKAKYYETKGEYNVSLEILNELTKGNIEKINILSEEGKRIISSLETKGNVYLKQNQPDRAEEIFKKILKFDEKNSAALKGLGDIYLLQKDNKAAFEQYTKVLEIQSDNDDVKLKLAEICKNTGKEEQANKYYAQVLSDAPLNPEANYNLGLMCLRKGDTEEAEKQFKKALSVNPLNSSIWVDLAVIEITNKNYVLARNYLNPISYINEKNPYYYYYLGLIDKSEGDLSSARDNFDKALQLKPDFDEVNQALESL